MSFDSVTLVGQGGAVTGNVTTAAGTSPASATFMIGVVIGGSTINVTSVGDNKDNSYTQIDSPITMTGGMRLAWYRCIGGNGGAGHEAEVAFSGANHYSTVYLIAVPAQGTIYFDTFAKDADDSSPYSIPTGALDSDHDEHCILTLIGWNYGSDLAAASSNTTILGSEPDSTDAWPNAVSVHVTSSHDSFSPSFTASPPQNAFDAILFSVVLGVVAEDEPPPPAGGLLSVLLAHYG